MGDFIIQDCTLLPREFVREHFLLTRQLREYLTLFHILSSREDSSTIRI